MPMTRKEKALAYFKRGYNCSQAVFMAFAEDYGFEEEMALRISASFGAGMGRMREVCGTVSGMSLVAGMETGCVDGSLEGKKKNYEMVQKLAGIFRERNGTIICRELLGLGQNKSTGNRDNYGLTNETDAREHLVFTDATPEERTEQYYKKRPCLTLIGEAVEILEQEFYQDKKDTAV